MSLFRPVIAGATLSGRLAACAGAGVAITLTMLACAATGLGWPGVPLLIAATGGSAVLVFAVPASPLAQPWPVIGGNVIATLVGVAAFRFVPDLAIAAGVAVGGSMLVMSLCRCLHPPASAAALAAVAGTPAVHAVGYGYALMPVAINAVILVALAMAFHRVTGHSYPHRPAAPPAPSPAGLARADIDAALADMHESFDIAREDLDALLARAEAHALARRGT